MLALLYITKYMYMYIINNYSTTWIEQHTKLLLGR